MKTQEALRVVAGQLEEKENPCDLWQIANDGSNGLWVKPLRVSDITRAIITDSHDARIKPNVHDISDQKPLLANIFFRDGKITIGQVGR